jgi:hypothetical protein
MEKREIFLSGEKRRINRIRMKKRKDFLNVENKEINKILSQQGLDLTRQVPLGRIWKRIV